jgi:hypothetical protein
VKPHERLKSPIPHEALEEIAREFDLPLLPHFVERVRHRLQKLLAKPGNHEEDNPLFLSMAKQPPEAVAPSAQ